MSWQCRVQIDHASLASDTVAMAVRLIKLLLVAQQHLIFDLTFRLDDLNIALPQCNLRRTALARLCLGDLCLRIYPQGPMTDPSFLLSRPRCQRSLPLS